MEAKLKPVIRTVETAISGAIKTITPIGTLAVATATNLVSLETYSTNVNVEGKFLVMGLPGKIQFNHYARYYQIRL
jgi:hypothetical protein